MVAQNACHIGETRSLFHSGAVYVQNTLSLQRGCEKSEPSLGNPGQDLYAIDNIPVTN